MIVRKGTFSVTDALDNRVLLGEVTLIEAMEFAAKHVGNNSFAKPWADEHVYFFGPGDGTTMLLVREDVDIKIVFEAR